MYFIKEIHKTCNNNKESSEGPESIIRINTKGQGISFWEEKYFLP